MGGFLLPVVSLSQRGGEDNSIVCYVRWELSSPLNFLWVARQVPPVLERLSLAGPIPPADVPL